MAGIDEWGKEYDPKKGAQSIRTEELLNGDYTIRVVSAGLVEQGGYTMCKIVARIVAGEESIGGCMEVTQFLKDPKDLNRLGADFKVLGFDTEKWGDGKKTVSQYIHAACKTLEEHGGRVFGVKKTSRDDASKGRTYHNLMVLGIRAMPDGEQMPTGGKGRAQPEKSAESEGDIPF